MAQKLDEALKDFFQDGGDDESSCEALLCDGAPDCDKALRDGGADKLYGSLVRRHNPRNKVTGDAEKYRRLMACRQVLDKKFFQESEDAGTAATKKKNRKSDDDDGAAASLFKGIEWKKRADKAAAAEKQQETRMLPAKDLSGSEESSCESLYCDGAPDCEGLLRKVGLEELYRARALKYHPDNKDGGDEETFKKLTSCKSVLRKKYPTFADAPASSALVVASPEGGEDVW